MAVRLHKDIAFEGVVLVLVSLLFLLMTIIEIPFYPQEIEVQKYVLVALGGSFLVLLFGLFYGRKPKTAGNPISQ